MTVVPFPKTAHDSSQTEDFEQKRFFINARHSLISPEDKRVYLLKEKDMTLLRGTFVTSGIRIQGNDVVDDLVGKEIAKLNGTMNFEALRFSVSATSSSSIISPIYILNISEGHDPFAEAAKWIGVCNQNDKQYSVLCRTYPVFDFRSPRIN